MKIYYCRENKNREEFIYDRIEPESIVIVPEQFTLQAEKDALAYMKREAMMDIEIQSFSSIARRIVQETGGMLPMIDVQGRKMLLTRIMLSLNNELELFKNYATNSDFIDNLLTFIGQLKENGTSCEKLRESRGSVEDKKLLAIKLDEIGRIFEAYELALEGKRLDNEDYFSLVAGKMTESKAIKSKNIWLYGFDYLTKKDIELVKAFEENAMSVSMVINYSEDSQYDTLFKSTGRMVDLIRQASIDVEMVEIKDCHDFKATEEIALIERKAFSLMTAAQQEKTAGIGRYEGDVCSTDGLGTESAITEEKANKTAEEENGFSQSVILCSASDRYDEFKKAAELIQTVIRQKNIKYRDIAVISGNLQEDAGPAKRIFAQYGMDLFVDSKRGIMHTPAAVFIKNLLEYICEGFNPKCLFKIAKTGMVDVDDEDVEVFEYYCREYSIKSGEIKSEFKRGYKGREDELAHLNDIRAKLVEDILTLNEEIKASATGAQKAQTMLAFLEDKARVNEKLKDLLSEQEEQGDIEAAAETAQVWEAIKSIFQQIIEIMPEDRISKRDFAAVVLAGLESQDIGLIPPYLDGLIMGNFERSRRAGSEVTIILSANDGVLPKTKSDEGLLSREETEILENRNYEIVKSHKIQASEERLAIYRSMARTQKLLYMSFCEADIEGKAMFRSTIFMDIEDLLRAHGIEFSMENFISATERGRMISAGVSGYNQATLSNLIAALREGEKGEEIEKKWLHVLKWFYEKGCEKEIRQGIEYSNEMKNLRPEEIEKLYFDESGKKLKTAASKLETHARCPFMHFVKFGLRPSEMRKFEIDMPDIGTLYHECMRMVTEYLSEEDVRVCDSNSKWQQIEREEVDRIIDEFFDKQIEEYREGVLVATEEAKYRLSRIKRACKLFARAMILQVRKDGIEHIGAEIKFEEAFKIPDFQMQVEDHTIVIRGQIDRVDFMSNNYVRIVDYKTGSKRFEMSKVKAGLDIQLFLYLIIAGEKFDRKKGGCFYFDMSSPTIKTIESKNISDLNDVEDEIEEKFLDKSKYTGLRTAAEDFQMEGSRIKGTDGFDEEIEEVREVIAGIARSILRGRIDINPARGRDDEDTPCEYCGYKGICTFEKDMRGCGYRLV